MHVAALWLPKAAEWLNGRKNHFENLETELGSSQNIVWMHCASAGEFEQGKPVLEALKKAYPNYKFLVSFFSPSGYKVGKKYAGVDFVTYLPLDTASNANRFIKLVNPALVVFVKYDYWYHHFKAVFDQRIPLLLISAIYRDNQVFFKPYGNFHRKMLHLFSWLFVQDSESVERLNKIGISKCSVSGDTRFDRVAAIINSAAKIDLIETFTQNGPTIVAGSTWAEDENLFGEIINGLNYKLIIAPHEISAKNIKHLLDLFPGKAITYSELQNGIANPDAYKILIIDNIGMLSRLYQYATITYIGGGFNKSGIHNTLEAAAWGKPVIFGPNYQKFREARELINAGAAFSIANAYELKNAIAGLEGEQLKMIGEAAKTYVETNGGATTAILQYIQENRLLTTA
ncbi:MAG: 3-deoxy-D-manno-octulosonic acid transferase [Flaviaesturariibacter sp.]|nr:3-deoxy-D-manno-octulosonic acid transferase [Flaviaesturariibacter sp.]